MNGPPRRKPPEKIGPYELRRCLGEGGFGAVYLAVHVRTGGRFAIKVLHAEFVHHAEISRRFLDEARAVNRISDPGIVRIVDYDLLPEGGGAFLVMEYLRGVTLKERLSRGPLGLSRALRVAAQLAAILHAAHRRGIFHRDLKPDNIMIVRDREVPGRERPKILDFGIAKLVEAEGSKSERKETRSGLMIGTVGYMPPEQALDFRRADDRADVYSLGVLIYEMIMGCRPFHGSSIDILAQQTREPAPGLFAAGGPPPGEVEHQVADLVARMLLRDAKLRPPMREVAATLEALHARARGELLPTRTGDTGPDTTRLKLQRPAPPPPPVPHPAPAPPPVQTPRPVLTWTLSGVGVVVLMLVAFFGGRFTSFASATQPIAGPQPLDLGISTETALAAPRTLPPGRPADLSRPAPVHLSAPVPVPVEEGCVRSDDSGLRRLIAQTYRKTLERGLLPGEQIRLLKEGSGIEVEAPDRIDTGSQNRLRSAYSYAFLNRPFPPRGVVIRCK